MEGRAALWTLVGIFVVFKVATTAMIMIYDPGAAQFILGLFVAFHWPMILGGVAFGLFFAAAAVLFRARLLRVRARRRELEAAEWHVE